MEFCVNTIKYGERTILNEIELLLIGGRITTVYGESGSGKTSLFSYLTTGKGSFNINGYQIRKPIISYCSQEPAFIRYLTLQQHIDMLSDIYQQTIGIEKYIDLLQLKDSLNKLPDNLSGGEKKRAAFLLCIMRPAELYIFDEPTASLNKDFSLICHEILEDLKTAEKIILVFTHDRVLGDYGDIIYTIEGKELKLEKKSGNKGDNQVLQLQINKNEDCISRYLLKNYHNHHLAAFLPGMILSVCVGMTGILFSRGNLVYQTQQEVLKKMNSNEIIVFKENAISKDEKGNIYYNYNDQPPFTDEEVKVLENLDHVENVEWRADIIEMNQLYEDIAAQVPEDKNYMEIALIKDDKNLGRFTAEELIVSTYLQNHKQNKDIETDLNESGVYISRSMASEFEKKFNLSDQDLKDVRISFFASVPIYNTSGRTMAARGNNDYEFITNTTVTHEKLQLPIAGILSWSSFGLESEYSNVIYVERGVLEAKINEHRRSSARKVYVMDESWQEYYVNQLPEGVTKPVLYTFIDEVWRPTAYSVFVDSIENVPEVIKRIEEEGFLINSEYKYNNGILDGISGARNVFNLSAILFFLMVCFGSAGMEILHKKEKMDVKLYLESIGISRSGILKSFGKYNLGIVFSNIGYVALTYVLYFGYQSYVFHGPILPDVLSVLLSAFSMLISFYVIPCIFDRRSA